MCRTYFRSRDLRHFRSGPEMSLPVAPAPPPRTKYYFVRPDILLVIISTNDIIFASKSLPNIIGLTVNIINEKLLVFYFVLLSNAVPP